MYRGLGGTRNANSSIIYETFQGQIEVTSLTRKKIVLKSSDQNSSTISDHNNSAGVTNSHGNSQHNNDNTEVEEKKNHSSKTVSIVDTLHEDEDSGVRMEERWIQEQNTTPFLFLTLDIPPTPLFKVYPPVNHIFNFYNNCLILLLLLGFCWWINYSTSSAV